MHDVGVLEAAHHVRDRIGLADVREELVAEAFTLRRAGDEARDVDELDRGRQDLLRLDDRRKRVEPRIRHRHDADVRVDGAERIVLRRDLRARQRVEQRGLADVGKPDDAALDSHLATPFLRRGAAWPRACSLFMAICAPERSISSIASAPATMRLVDRALLVRAGARQHEVDDFVLACPDGPRRCAGARIHRPARR